MADTLKQMNDNDNAEVATEAAKRARRPHKQAAAKPAVDTELEQHLARCKADFEQKRARDQQYAETTRQAAVVLHPAADAQMPELRHKRDGEWHYAQKHGDVLQQFANEILQMYGRAYEIDVTELSEEQSAAFNAFTWLDHDKLLRAALVNNNGRDATFEVQRKRLGYLCQLCEALHTDSALELKKRIASFRAFHTKYCELLRQARHPVTTPVSSPASGSDDYMHHRGEQEMSASDVEGYIAAAKQATEHGEWAIAELARLIDDARTHHADDEEGRRAVRAQLLASPRAIDLLQVAQKGVFYAMEGGIFTATDYEPMRSDMGHTVFNATDYALDLADDGCTWRLAVTNKHNSTAYEQDIAAVCPDLAGLLRAYAPVAEAFRHPDEDHAPLLCITAVADKSRVGAMLSKQDSGKKTGYDDRAVSERRRQYRDAWQKSNPSLRYKSSCKARHVQDWFKDNPDRRARRKRARDSSNDDYGTGNCARAAAVRRK